MDRMQNDHYEELFNRLLDRGMVLHASNKRRIRIGLIFLVVFTVAMILIRFVTESDRATFLIIWVIGMFAISIYLIGIEYIDTSIEKTLEDVTEMDTGWDDLILDSEAVRGKVQERIDDRRGEMSERMNERRAELKERFQTRSMSAVKDEDADDVDEDAPESEDEE